MLYTLENPKLKLFEDIPFFTSHFFSKNSFTGVVKDKGGNILHFENGKLHRVGGPAIECVNGEKRWFIHGKLHREDGAAIEYADGNKEWWVYNYILGWNDDFTVESWINWINERRALIAKNTKA